MSIYIIPPNDPDFPKHARENGPSRCPHLFCREPLSYEEDKDGYYEVHERYEYLNCPKHGRVWYLSGWAHGWSDPDAPGRIGGPRVAIHNFFFRLRHNFMYRLVPKVRLWWNMQALKWWPWVPFWPGPSKGTWPMYSDDFEF